MQKGKLNFLVDAVAFVAFVLLTATGVLVRYVLPPGSGRSRVLWGMDRHGWGQLHFWIAVVLMACVTLHLFLHWRWVVCIVKGRPREESGHRVALAVVGLLALVGLAAAPFFGPVEQADEPQRSHREASETSSRRIVGSMTLEEVEQATGVPTQAVLWKLGLPASVPTDVPLARLREERHLELRDVRNAVRGLLEAEK